jgi:outer membrane immunogenic protein
MKGLLLAAIAGAALVAGAPANAADLVAPGPLSTWTGCYIGANAGGVWSQADITWVPNPAGFPVSGPTVAAVGSNRINTSGFTGGGGIGCNYQASFFVIGLEGDGQYTGINATLVNSFPGCATCGVGGTPLGPMTVTETVRSRWLATVRGRAGIAVSTLLLYVTGGAAVAEASFADNFIASASGTFNAASSSTTREGWVAGGGAEWLFVRSWSVKAEYLHVDLGTVSFTSANSNPLVFPLATIVHNHGLTENIGRIGVNYLFNRRN